MDESKARYISLIVISSEAFFMFFFLGSKLSIVFRGLALALIAPHALYYIVIARNAVLNRARG